MTNFKTFLEATTSDDAYIKVFKSILKDNVGAICKTFNTCTDPAYGLFSAEYPFYTLSVHKAFTNSRPFTFSGEKFIYLSFSITLPNKLWSQVGGNTFITTDFALEMVLPPREMLIDKTALTDMIVSRFGQIGGTRKGVWSNWAISMDAWRFGTGS